MYCASYLAEGLHIMSQPQPTNQDSCPQCHAEKAAEREFNEHKPPTLQADARHSARCPQAQVMSYAEVSGNVIFRNQTHSGESENGPLLLGGKGALSD